MTFTRWGEEVTEEQLRGEWHASGSDAAFETWLEVELNAGELKEVSS